jgi:hypothetical protein
LRNANAKQYLHALFQSCFESGMVPDIWCKGIIKPIPKGSTSDRRNPVDYRGLTLASAIYKLYCGILNTRLSTWAEAEGLLVDEQNAFRKGRSTIDHLSTLTNIIEHRK